MTDITQTQNILTTHAAAQLGAAAMEHAYQLNIHISICVVDLSGQPLVSLRMNQSPLISPSIAEKKAFTAVSFRKPTRDWQSTLADKENILLALQSEPKFTFLGGGLPVQVGNSVVGAIGVSGGSEAQDIECAEAALQFLLHQN